jgi:hypothetical protein
VAQTCSNSPRPSTETSLPPWDKGTRFSDRPLAAAVRFPLANRLACGPLTAQRNSEADPTAHLFALARAFLGLVARELVFARRALAGRDLVAPDFFAAGRVAFLGRTDFTSRLAAGTAARAVFATALTPLAVCRATRLIAGIIGLPLSARFPTTAPITPPTTAPTGPPTAPRTAPVAAPAADFEIAGIAMFSFDPDLEAEDLDLFAIGFVWFFSGSVARGMG